MGKIFKDEALASLARIYRMQIIVGLQKLFIDASQDLTLKIRQRLMAYRKTLHVLFWLPC